MDFVMPGEIIAREEEFENEENTYVDDDGNIRSSVIGIVRKDNINKTISVVNKDKIIEIGDVVEAVVIDRKDKLVIVSIKKVYSKNMVEKPNYLGVAAAFMANLSVNFVEDIKDVARIGDVLRAKILNINGTLIDLSMKGPELGVMLAFCSKCRHKMYLYKQDFSKRDFAELKCSNCGHIEKRRVSKFYIYKKGDLNENRSIRL